MFRATADEFHFGIARSQGEIYGTQSRGILWLIQADPCISIPNKGHAGHLYIAGRNLSRNLRFICPVHYSTLAVAP